MENGLYRKEEDMDLLAYFKGASDTLEALYDAMTKDGFAITPEHLFRKILTAQRLITIYELADDPTDPTRAHEVMDDLGVSG